MGGTTMELADEWGWPTTELADEWSRRSGGVSVSHDMWSGPHFETAIDRQIREATERGAFDNLPGAGKPIPDIDGPHDDLWWVKQLVRREKVSLVPPSIALKREAEDVMTAVAAERSEWAVRRLVADLNERIAANLRLPLEGPPVHVAPLDVERVVQAWRDQR